MVPAPEPSALATETTEPLEGSAVGSAQATVVGDASAGSSARRSGRSGLRRGDGVGRYLVVEEVGRGAMGVVYAAIDPELERRVAVKVLHRGRARLLGEARALARLAHPNVVGVYDVGETDGCPFIAMELIDGLTVDEWLHARPRRWEEIVDVFIAAGRGLAAAHGAGLVHRDFKPANVMVARDGAIKVTDFGLARAAEEEGTDQGRAAPRGDSDEASTFDEAARRTGLGAPTATRGRIGTPAFMAPELHHGEAASASADQFSFCVALYQCLYGEHPFAEGSVVAVIAAVVSGELRDPPASSTVPARLRRLLVQGLRSDPAQRHASVEALVEALVALRAPSRRAWWLAAAVGVVGVGTWLALRPPPPDPCANAGSEIEQVWTQEQGTRLRAAFEASELPFAARASEEAVRRLDAYAEQWRTLRGAACRGQRATDVAEARNAALAEQCLERARSDLLAVTEVLVAGELPAIIRSTELVYGLPPLLPCTDPSHASALPIPDEPRTRADVARVRARLSQLRAWRTGGRVTETDELDALVEDAEGLGFAPLRAEVALERAMVLLGPDRAGGVKEMERALQLAVEGDADLLAAEVIAQLLGNDGDGMGAHDRAAAWEQLARGYLRRWPERGRLRLRLQAALSRTLSTRGDYDEAVELAREAAALADALDDPWRASIHRGNYGMILARAGRMDDAIGVLSAHVEHTVELLGPEHPDAAWAYNALCSTYINHGEATEARPWCERAVEVYRQYDEDPLERAQALGNLANVLRSLGELDSARRAALEGVELVRGYIGGDHPTLASLLNSLGSYASEEGDSAAAVGYFEESLQMRQRLGDAPLQQLLPTANLAPAYLAAGDPDAARRQLEATTALFEQHVPDEYPLAGQVQYLVGDTYRRLGDTSKAIEHLELAERLLRTMLGAQAELTVQVARDLGELRAGGSDASP